VYIWFLRAFAIQLISYMEAASCSFFNYTWLPSYLPRRLAHCIPVYLPVGVDPL